VNFIDYPERPCAYCGEVIRSIGPSAYEWNPQLVACGHCGKVNVSGYKDGHFIWRKREWKG